MAFYIAVMSTSERVPLKLRFHAFRKLLSGFNYEYAGVFV